jgi:uncharacterized protein (TIGR03118 family)
MNSRYIHHPFLPTSWLRPVALLIVAASSVAAANSYFVHNLISDLPGVADQVAPGLVNPWGIYSFGTSVLIATNGNGSLSQYSPVPGVVQPPFDPNLSPGITVIMPSAKGLPQPGTGLLANGVLSCTKAGTIIGLIVGSPATTTTAVDNSASGAVYSGCTTWAFSTQGSGAPFYYAANFNSGKIDVWDANLSPVRNAAAFVDPSIPPGFAPFNIQGVSQNVLLVTYARQDASKTNDVPGAGNGYIAAFDYNGNLLSTLVAQGPLNSPWAVTVARSTFGDFGNMLLVGNSGDGKINAFDLTTGAWKGTLADPQGNPIAIPGLRDLEFGGGDAAGDPSTLYFTADIGGPGGAPLGSHGLFGSIQAAPFVPTQGVLNGSGFSTAIAPNTWVTLKGGSLSATTRSWTIGDFTNDSLPTKLDGISVTVNGEPGFVSYISPTQINFLVPADLAPGPVEIVTASNGLKSAPIPATLANAAPAFFYFSPGANADDSFIVGLHANNSPATLVLPGETVALFGTGFGATMPAAPNGQLLSAALPLIQPVTVTIGGQAVPVAFVGLAGPGLYQVNVLLPTVDPKYRWFPVPVTLSIPGVVTQASGSLAYDWAVIN